jgi:predicted anti-sigma-YlaC factor YlaD
VQVELSHKEARGLFGALIDEELPAREERRLRVHLDGCGDCRAGWERYARAVSVVRKVEREKAPPNLAGQILRRIRRRRFNGLRANHIAHLQNRVPVEAIIPVLLGFLVAAMLVFLAPQ